MTIRLFTTDDYPQAQALWHRTTGIGLNPADDSPEGIARYLARNPATCFVAMEDETVMGTILCGHDGRRGFIYHLCTAEHLRKKGIGKALVEAALTALKAEGIHKAALVCFNENQPGNAFWRACGWELRKDLNYYNLYLNDN